MLSAKSPNETITITFDYSGETSSTPSAATCTGTIYQGTDSTALSFGSASISGTNVAFAISGGTDGAIYDLVCSATVGGVTIEMYGTLVVRSLPR